MTDWTVYPGGKSPIDDDARAAWLSAARTPPWRRPAGDWSDRPDKVEGAAPSFDADDEGARRDLRRAETYITTGVVRDDARAVLDRPENRQVNFALLLRRPLLVRGPPGIGKSTLAYHIAWIMGLGRPFRWEIDSTTTLSSGLYTYDAVAHFHAGGKKASVADHIRLGPLGTALCPTERPGCVLVDELDKASYDLPNDLLHAFEEGAFEIPELRDHDAATIDTRDGRKAPVHKGLIRCHHHPVVVITTNDEREFPEAFLRRCVVLDLDVPQPEELRAIVAAQLEDAVDLDATLAAFAGRPTDRLLQALHLRAAGVDLTAILAGLEPRR